MLWPWDRFFLPESCWSLAESIHMVVSTSLMDVVGCREDIVGASDYEAKSASFHFPEILPVEFVMFQFFPVGSLAQHVRWTCATLLNLSQIQVLSCPAERVQLHLHAREETVLSAQPLTESTSLQWEQLS